MNYIGTAHDRYLDPADDLPEDEDTLEMVLDHNEKALAQLMTEVDFLSDPALIGKRLLRIIEDAREKAGAR